MPVVPYDVQLNGKKYRIIDRSYIEAPIRDTIRPGNTPGGDPTFRDNENPEWAWWGQSEWAGSEVEDWGGNDGFYRGYGCNLDNTGEVHAAKTFTQLLSLPSNTDGLLFFTVQSGDRAVLLDKTSGNAYTTTDLVTTTGPHAIGAFPTSWAFFRGTLVVACGNGTLKTSTDGQTWSAFPTLVPPSSNPCYVLGSYLGKLYLAWGNDLYTWDGAALSPKIITLDATPVTAAVGAGVMFIMGQGNPSRMYIANGATISEMAQWPSEFQPDDSIFTDTLYTAGGGPDGAGGQFGHLYRYTALGLELLYDFPAVHGAGVDYRIRSLGVQDNKVLFSYNKGAGYGVYDSSLDVWEDPVLGLWLSSRTNNNFAGAGRVIGIFYFKGTTIIGVTSGGVYKETGYCDFQVTSSLFGSTSKRVNKLWNLCELTFTPLKTGQTVAMEYSTDGGTTWTPMTMQGGLSVGQTKVLFTFPTNTFSAVMQYRVTGTANNQEMAVVDVSFSFIEASQAPKRRWRFRVDLFGTADEPMPFRDGSLFDRSSIQMKNELDALWNTKFQFIDIFGKTYTVMMPAPAVSVNEVDNLSDDANPDSVTGVDAEYTVNLVEV